ncbi:MAG: hypothetical protein HYT70_01615 [Candidatus Aenigmarchaeota archaeon]|nr:hypothetical protein [Candidatus Aenigmarchaeota archaeon]
MARNHQTSKYLVPVALLLIGVSIVLFLVSQNGVTSSYSIKTISQTCFTEPHDLDVRGESNSIIITAPMSTPNPCYYAGGNVDFRNGDINVRLIPFPEGGVQVCVQCIGEIVGEVVVQNLSSGVHEVNVTTPDRTVTTSITVK